MKRRDRRLLTQLNRAMATAEKVMLTQSTESSAHRAAERLYHDSADRFRALLKEYHES